MSMLSGARLRQLIFHTSTRSDRLVISPLLDPDSQLRNEQASIDLRLGNVFITQRRTETVRLDPWDSSPGDELFLEEQVYVPFRRPFVLHPNQFALGCTLEYLGLPSNLSAYVMGRSSLGRVGLVVATAAGVHPGYRGVITMELRNLAEVPLSIYPGMRICQAFFHQVEPPADLDLTYGSYRLSTRPEFARIQLPQRDRGALEALGDRLGVSHIRPRLG